MSTMLKSANGNVSSKRVMGVTYMAVALVMALVDQLTSYDISTFEVWVSIVVTGASLLGLGLFEYFGKIDKPPVK